MKFIKATSKDYTAFYVYSDGRICGHVRKFEAWTVRGDVTRWEAYNGGKFFGEFDTRKQAGEFLSALA